MEGHLSILHAIILGAIQGASEFLPISSSGHLVIFQHLLGVDLESGPMVAFDVCLHIGTLIAVLVALRSEVFLLIRGLFNPSYEYTEMAGGFTAGTARRAAWLIILGTIPAVIIGFAFKDFFESMFSSMLPVGIALLVTGTFLFSTRWVRTNDVTLGKMKWWHALIVGCAQAAAIFPGISRSGSTITAGLFSKLDRGLAAKFSFLLSIPAIGGAAVLQFDNLKHLSGGNILPTIVGTIVSAVIGYACVRWILAIMRGRNFSAFAYYCWAVGLVTVIWTFASS